MTELIHKESNLPVTSDRAYKIWQVRQGIYANVAKTVRKAARSWHVQVDKCAGAKYKRGGIVECKKQDCVKGIGFYFRFTTDDAENLLNTHKAEE